LKENSPLAGGTASAVEYWVADDMKIEKFHDIERGRGKPDYYPEGSCGTIKEEKKKSILNTIDHIRKTLIIPVLRTRTTAKGPGTSTR